MKTCFKCKEEKSIDCFYKHPNMPDGHVNKCKECNKKDVTKNRKKNSEYYREYDKGRAMLPHRVEARKAYIATDAGKESRKKSTTAYRDKNPNKYKAHTMIGNAIRDGKLFKEACCICNSKDNIHGHHDDYSKPLNVRWLCSACHTKWHKENGEALNP